MSWLSHAVLVHPSCVALMSWLSDAAWPRSSHANSSGARTPIADTGPHGLKEPAPAKLVQQLQFALALVH